MQIKGWGERSGQVIDKLNEIELKPLSILLILWRERFPVKKKKTIYMCVRMIESLNKNWRGRESVWEKEKNIDKCIDV